MMQYDWYMEVHTYDKGTRDDGLEESRTFKDLLDTAKGRVHYFQPIPNKRNKNGTSIVFRIFTEHSHVTWRQHMEQDIKEYNLYIGVHKLESTEMEIIRFPTQNHPEMAHFSQCKIVLMSQLPKGTPKLVIECIFPKMMDGFKEPMKMDVLTIRVCKTDAKVVDEAGRTILHKLLGS
jgi:hypothetical protein